MDATTVVLDMGSHSVKAGYAGASAPEVIRSIAGTFKYKPTFGFHPNAIGPSSSVQQQQLLQGVVGREVDRHRGLLRLSYPIRHSVVTDWAAVQTLITQAQQCVAQPHVASAAPPPPAMAGEHAVTPTASVNIMPSSAAAASSHFFALVEPPFASRVQRRRLVEQLLETGCSSDKDAAAAADGGGGVVGGVFCGVAPLLSLYSTGETTGLVLDVGEGTVSTAAALHGFALTDVMQRQDGDATGGAVTAYFASLMRQYGTLETASYESGGGGSIMSGSALQRRRRGVLLDACVGVSELELARSIKERCCTVSPTLLPSVGDIDCHNASSGGAGGGEDSGAIDALLVDIARNASSSAPQHQKQTYVLPDETELAVGAEAVYASEVLFRPALGLGSGTSSGCSGEGRGVTEMVLSTLALAELEARPALMRNIVLVGGATLSSGFGARFLSEILQRTPRGNKVRVVAPAERAYAAWTGAAFLSQLSTFASQMVVSRAEYEEHGECILQSRLFM